MLTNFLTLLSDPALRRQNCMLYTMYHEIRLKYLILLCVLYTVTMIDTHGSQCTNLSGSVIVSMKAPEKLT